MDPKSFYHRSKLCWLDLILQIFKVLVLGRVTHSSSDISQSTRKSASSIYHKLENIVDPEEKLLKWLTEVFNRNLSNLTRLDPDKNTDLLPRQIKNFCIDLSDGLVYIALVLHYCPYLEHYFHKIYVNVDTMEKAFHNAAKVIAVLNLLHCSFHLSPSEITYPCAIQMIMFCTYAYEVFPTFQPTSKLKFSVSLSKIKSQELTLKNANKYKIHYDLIFLNNDLQCFTANCGKTTEIAPKKTQTILLNFQAKKMSPCITILIFCGEVIGERYAKNIVFVLEGESDYIEEHASYNYRLPLYSLQNKHLNLQSPYQNKAAAYSIKITYSKPTSEKDFVPCTSVLQNIKLKLIHVKTDKFHADENGEGSLDITICSTSMLKQELWIFFINKDLGDFFVRVQISAMSLLHTDKEFLTLNVPHGWEEFDCLCSKNKYMDPSRCETNLIVRIPCRNNKLWSTLTEMFLISVKVEQLAAWKQQLGE